MARSVNRLTSRTVDGRLVEGRYSDGDGLYLVVDGSGRKRWCLLYRWRAAGAPGPGTRREMGLGPYAADSRGGLSLRDAREKARDARALIADGVDPIEERRRAAAPVAIPTFGEVADGAIVEWSKGYRSEKSTARLMRAIGPEGHAAALRPLRVDAITTEHVLSAVRPHWRKAKTGMLTRGYIERVLDAARARGWRSGENPARWRGHLDTLLSRPQGLASRHHAAMDYEAVPNFIAALRGQSGVSARALEFLILTAARTGEVLGATWDEIDLDRGVWSVPAHRMKSGRAHRVPLSPRALEILDEMRAASDSGPIFARARVGRSLSSMAMAMLLRRMGVHGATVHGFRSSFRDWAGEETHFPREVAEAALAHTVGDAAERAYRRGDALEKRRQMMTAWADFLSGEARQPIRLVVDR